MSIEAERYVNETPPTPEQLHKLASVGVRSAVSRKRFKTMKSRSGVHYFIDELDFLAEMPTDVEDPVQVRHRIAARVAAYPAHAGGAKSWSLKYFDTYFTEPTPGVWRGERSTYRFEWTRGRVLLAERTMRLIGFGVDPIDTVEETLDRLHLPDDTVPLLQVENELQAVTDKDCEDLIVDMSNYFSTVDTMNRR